MRQKGGILAMILGLGAFSYHGGSANKLPKGLQKTPIESSASVAGSIADWDLLKSLSDFYDLDVVAPANTTLSDEVALNVKDNDIHARVHAGTRANPAFDSFWRKKLVGRFDWFIATVPDPELSELRLDFDREVNTIQNAVEAGGYHFDRFWFPWRDSVSNQTAGQRTAANGRRTLPGLLLFRNRYHALKGSVPCHRDVAAFSCWRDTN